MAADIVRFMDERGLDRTHLLGHSMGGKVAMEVALRNSERVDRLIVADMAPRSYPDLGGPVFAALAELDLASVASKRQADAALAHRLSDPGLRAFLVMGLETGEGGRLRWRFHFDALLAARDSLGRAIDGARRFPGPALFIRGERSEYVTEADWPAILRLFPAARLASIARAGHWLHIEQREAFCSDVLAFLDRPS
jgi:pimeloyl-ACP methyl ester carboxylesterase